MSVKPTNDKIAPGFVPILFDELIEVLPVRALAASFLLLLRLPYKGERMPRVDRSALVLQSAEHMYQLVADIASYPEFLPGCAASEVLSQSAEQVTASLTVSKGGVSQQFTTRNVMTPVTRIDLELVEGPFSHLRGCWVFQPLDENASKISLQLEFEFASKLAEKAFSKVFSTLTESMVKAFIERSKEVYGVAAC